MKSHINTRMFLIASLTCALAVAATAQTPVTLFQDGFENETPGLSPDNPEVGSYLISGTTAGDETNEVQILTGAYPGGPSGAFTGANYLMIDRINYQAANQILHCLFASPLFATNTPFHVELRMWADHLPVDNSWPQLVIGSGTAVSAAAQLLYSANVVRNGYWQWYNGTYHDSNLRFNAGQWDFVEMDWDGTNMTGRINGTGLPLGIWGSSDKVVNRLLIRTGTTQTQFFVDDVKITTTATILLRSLQPAPGATGVGRQPTVQIQLTDATQAVADGSIHLYFDNVEVSPEISASVQSGLNVTTVSYLPPVLPYGSAHTVRCVYGDQAVPANEYTREWSFTVYTGDTIFADNFETSIPLIVPFHADASEGTNCLTMARIGAGRPILQAAGDLAQSSGDGDTISITFDFAPWISELQNGTLAVIPGYAYESGGQIAFDQTGQINVRDDGMVSVVDLSGSVNQYLDTKMNTSAWNTISILYVNGTADWSVSVNGSAYTNFYGKSSQGGFAYGNVNGIRLATAGNGTTWCDNFTISNLTANTLLFHDGFENTPRGEAPATNSPTVGSYITVDPSTVAGGLFVSDGVNGNSWLPAPPNAPQTGSYETAETTAMVFNGTGHGGTKYVNLTQGSMIADFITPIPSGVKLHFESWINWLAGQVSYGFDAGGGNQFAKVTLMEDTSVTLFDGSAPVNTGLTHKSATWEKCELDYVVGASTITVTLSGAAATLPITPVSTIGGIFFAENDALSSQAYVDDVRATAYLGELPATNPVLEAAQSGDQLVISWTNGAGYILQQNSNLANPSGWVSVPGGGTSPVQVPIGAGMYYRLSKPL